MGRILAIDYGRKRCGIAVTDPLKIIANGLETVATHNTMVDERFTSTIAHQAMIYGGMKKSDRRDKARVDTIAASIILNDYLQSLQFKGL